MTTTHTPGPWTKSNNVRQQDDAQRIYAGDIPVATVHHLPQKTTAAFYQAHANARLIAAAPDMLKALQLVASIWSSDQTGNVAPDSPLAIVRAAIARATA